MKQEFDLYLNNPKELFVFDLQTYDPFDANSLGEAGLEYLVARMIGFWFRAPQVLTRVYLPSEQMRADLQTQMQRAMVSWCDDLLIANRRERVEFVINNAIFFGVALLVLVLNWWLQPVVSDPNAVADASLRSWLGYGLDILLWVAVWTPLSAFLLEWFPLYRRYQAYRSLRNMELILHAQTADGLRGAP